MSENKERVRAVFLKQLHSGGTVQSVSDCTVFFVLSGIALFYAQSRFFISGF